MGARAGYVTHDAAVGDCLESVLTTAPGSRRPASGRPGPSWRHASWRLRGEWSSGGSIAARRHDIGCLRGGPSSRATHLLGGSLEAAAEPPGVGAGVDDVGAEGE